VRSEVGTVQAAVFRRFWPTSTCTTYSTFGSTMEKKRRRKVTWSSCVLPMTSSLGSSTDKRPSDSSRNSANGFAQFGLELHPDKTRLIEFGRHADKIDETAATGTGELSTFWASTPRNPAGKPEKAGSRAAADDAPKVAGKSSGGANRTENDACTTPSRKWAPTCARFVTGHYRYYGVPMNGPALGAFRNAIALTWRWMLRRRSQKSRMPWSRFREVCRALAATPPHLPSLSLVRFAVTTQGKSRMAVIAACPDLWRGYGWTMISTSDCRREDDTVRCLEVLPTITRNWAPGERPKRAHRERCRGACRQVKRSSAATFG